jgi:hydrogenase maturation protease
MSRAKTFLFGIGSGYGDDQAGWRVIDAVEAEGLPEVTVDRGRSPSDLLDRLAGIERLHLCDACHGAGPVGSWHRWRWPAAEIQPVRFSGSHDLGLAAVLELAERLGQLPGEVLLWGIEGKQDVSPEDLLEEQLSAEVEQAVVEVAHRIAAELSDGGR